MKLLLFLFFSSLQLFAQSTLWQGTIGQNESYMELACDPRHQGSADENSCRHSYYFDTDHLVNVLIKEGGPVGKNQIRLSSAWNKVSELFDLVLQDGELSGTLLRGDEIFPVSLKPYKVKDLDRLKADLFKFKEIEIEKLKHFDAKITWVKEKYSELIYPRVLSGFSENRIQTINTVLEKFHIAKSLDILRCGYGWSDSSGKEFTVSIGHVSQNLFSLVYVDMYSCSDGRNGSDIYGALYDMGTGEKYTLEHLMAFSKDTPVLDGTNWEVWERYKEEVFAPKIRDLVFEMKGWKIGGKEDKECYYSDVQYWKDATWFLTDKGVQIKPHYPYNMVGCRDAYAFILTPEWMEKYKNRNYPDILKESFKTEKGESR